MTYLDNAATSFPKPRCVLREVYKCINNYCANPGRSSHKLAAKCDDKIYEARELISDFVNCSSPERIIFTQNATHGLNLAIKGLIDSPCHVIISDLEHNAVVRPLYKAISRYGGRVSIFDSSLPIDEAIRPLICADTRLIVSTLSSNVTGRSIDAKRLSQISREYNIRLILDGSQYIGHIPLPVSCDDYDCLVAPGHKGLLGIQGAGFVALGRDAYPDTFIDGGNGHDTFNLGMGDYIPERYEGGTLSTPSIISMSAGISYINSIGINTIEEKINKLTVLAADALGSLGGITVYGAESGIVSFTSAKYTANDVAGYLSRHNVFVRGGFQCAPLIHKKLGTERHGIVRASFSYLNKRHDVDRLYSVIKGMLK